MLPLMNIIDFTHIFLPQLAADYVEGRIPLHGLVDIDTWRQVFPDSVTPRSDQFHWYQIQLTCNKLQDGTLLFSFVLPHPNKSGEPKFAAFRFSLESHRREVAYYLLQRPAKVDDAWDIHHVHLSADSSSIETQFLTKISGTDSLRNFVYSVQQTAFEPTPDEPRKEGNSILSYLSRKIKDALTSQDGNY